MRYSLCTVVLAVLAGGCAVGPDYRRPVTSLDLEFVNASQAKESGSLVDHYWTTFEDPLLESLVVEAVSYNKDLAAAGANLLAARAARRLAGFDLFPTVTASSSYSHDLYSKQQLSYLDRSEREFDSADAGFTGLWELDLFGRIRRNVEASRAEVGAVAATLQDARVSVIAEVSRNYFILRGLQDQLALTRRNADSQSATLRLTRARLEAGRGNELDTARAEAQWQTTLASIPSLESSIATTMYRLSVLTGRQPDALTQQLQPSTTQMPLPELTTIGTPEELLRNRPDIRIAERRLAGATARIGVAVADLFPKVTLTGTIGYQAASFNQFGARDAEFFSGGPGISWAAFDLGRVRARIGAAKAENAAALANYEGAVLNALSDTEGALVSFGRTKARRDALLLAASASDKAADLARKRFEGGLIDFLEVLDAERTALNAELLLSQSRADAATSLVAVYKALGGGWNGQGELAPSLARR